MTALALCAADMGKKISGSDTAEVFPTDAMLKKHHLKVKLGFSPANLPRHCDLVIYTGAHQGSDNPEVVAALKRNIPVLSHAQALGEFSTGKSVIAVAGVGGKSTVSSLIAHLLTQSGFRPSFSIGVGDIFSLPAPGKYVSKSPYFVAEADEFVTDPLKNLTPRFHYLKPYVAVITNLEYDHPDAYPSLDAVFDSFLKFIQPIPKNGAVIINIDNPRCKQFIRRLSRPIITYGFSPLADWQIIDHHVADKKQFFTLKVKGVTWPEMVLTLPGNYNLLNAAAALAAAYFLGASTSKLESGIKTFIGAKRRFELIDTVKKISLYDDYAHHPSEIKAVLRAARDWFPERRLIPIFQSHTYSRTKALLEQFSQSFSDADMVVINDIFPSAREKDNLGLTSQAFKAAIQKYHPHVYYCPDKSATLSWLKQHCRPGDILITLGAGNNWLWHKDILWTLSKIKF